MQSRTDSSASQVFQAHNSNIAWHLLDPENLHDKRVLDAGCGADGSFVRWLREIRLLIQSEGPKLNE